MISGGDSTLRPLSAIASTIPKNGHQRAIHLIKEISTILSHTMKGKKTGEYRSAGMPKGHFDVHRVVGPSPCGKPLPNKKATWFPWWPSCWIKGSLKYFYPSEIAFSLCARMLFDVVPTLIPECWKNVPEPQSAVTLTNNQPGAIRLATGRSIPLLLSAADRHGLGIFATVLTFIIFIRPRRGDFP